MTKSLFTEGFNMRAEVTQGLSKVPELTLYFWMIKIAATTLGETAGDAMSMSLNLGYVISSFIFLVFFIIFVILQMRSKRFSAPLYWLTIIATTTLGTTVADFASGSRCSSPTKPARDGAGA